MKQKNQSKCSCFFLTSLSLVALVLVSFGVSAAKDDAVFDLAITLKSPQPVAPGSK